jgi:hypothetical protein
VGHRYYDWAWLAIDPGRPGHHHLLIRRSRRTRELAFYRCYSPRPIPLGTLVKVAGVRWTTEENFQAGKGLTGLDEHQVRRRDSWYRWTTLAMLALAFLTITAATEHASPPPDDQTPLTRNEIAALFSALITDPVTSARHRLKWPAWRRRRQHQARTSSRLAGLQRTARRRSALAGPAYGRSAGRKTRATSGWFRSVYSSDDWRSRCALMRSRSSPPMWRRARRGCGARPS